MAREQVVRGGARVVAQTRVMVNVFTAYQKVDLVLTENRLQARWPTAVLGLVPIRTGGMDVAQSEVRSVRLVPVFFPARLAAALSLAAVVALTNLPIWADVPLTVLGFVLVMLSYVAAVRIDRDPGPTVIPVCWLQRRRVAGWIHTVGQHRSEP